MKTIFYAFFLYQMISMGATRADVATDSPAAEPSLAPLPDAAPEPTPASVPAPSPDSTVEVEWFRPYLVSQEKEGVLNVAITAKLMNATQVDIQESTLILDVGKKSILKMARDEIVQTSLPIQVDNDGMVKISIKSPPGVLSLPLVLRATDGAEAHFLLQIPLRNSDVTNLSQVAFSRSSSFEKRQSLWLGVGANFVFYKQSNDDIGVDANFQSMKFPSPLLAYRYRFTPAFNLWLSMKNSPGTVTSGDFQISPGDYNWLTTSMELQGRIHALGFKAFKSVGPTSLLLGLQKHQIPVLIRTELNSAKIESAESLWMSFGLTHEEELAPSWQIEMALRTQKLVSTTGSSRISSGSTLEASLGLLKSFSPAWKLGLYTYNHILNLEAETLDQLSGQTFKGQQSLQYWNTEIRLGFQFD